MTYTKYLIFFFALLCISCEQENFSKKSGTIQFAFSELTSSSGGRVKENVASILVTIHNENGEVVHERKELSLFQFDGEYLSEPVALTTGNYSLAEFLIMDANKTAVFATPLEGSPLAHLVDDPLPMSFSISKDNVTKVTPKVIRIEGNAATDFGYTTFGLDVVETFSFYLGVLSYNPSVKNFELTSSRLKITSSEEILLDRDLTAITNTIRIRDGFESYQVTVTKSGYGSYERTFTIDELRAYGSGTPLVVTLLVESLSGGLIAHYPFNGNANDQTANHMDGVVHGAQLTTDKNGNPEAAYSFDGVNDYISVTDSDLLDLSEFTISLWANIASDQQPHEGINDIVRKWNGDAQGYPFSISYLNTLADDATEDRIIHARYDGQGCNQSAISYSPLISNNTFVHVVLVKEGAKIRTYLNNVLTEEVTDPTTCSVANDANMTIGCRGNLVRFFKGKIDNIRIYDRPLSGSEISNLYGE